jgi:cytidylate kinase
MAIITISREMGSGGIPIAHQTAKELGYTLVDGDALKQVATEYGLSEQAFEMADEKPPAFVADQDVRQLADLHLIELMVLDFALKGNVIIYGRSGEDLLKEIRSVFRVRIIAPFEDRVECWAEREWLDPELARVLVRKSDQQRAGFTRYHFDRDWTDPLHYDLTINTQRLSEDKAVELICRGVKDTNLVEEKDNSKRILGDLILRKKAEIAVLTLPDVEGEHLVISASNSIITLAGQLYSKEEQRNVVAAAKAVPGVKSVVDQLTVTGYHNKPREH